MSDMVKVFAFENHRYEDRARRQIFEIQPGDVRDFPEDVAEYILENHPNKLTRIDSQADLDVCLEEFHSLHADDDQNLPRAVPPSGPRYSSQKRRLRQQTASRSRKFRVSIRDG